MSRRSMVIMADILVELAQLSDWGAYDLFAEEVHVGEPTELEAS